LDETLIDLREQATAKIGRQAISIGIPHAFLVGAFLGGNPWAAAIKNVQPPTTFSSGGIQPAFGTTAIQVKDSAVFIEGAGSAAVTKEDRNLLRKISSRKPRRSEEIMKLLGEVSCRAAESRRSGSQSVSRSCTVVYMPPTGDGVRQEWYGPEMDRQQARVEVSHLLFGIDLAEVVRPMHENFRALADGQINEEEFERMVEASARKSVQPRNRSTQPKE
jgi:hypothetical protein